MKPNADYRQILSDALTTRCQRNPKYSLRAFARDLGISAPRLSNILNGKFGLSPEAAIALAARLGLNSDETAHFRDLVESAHARNRTQRHAARNRVRSKSKDFEPLALDGFQLISDWHHNAILELTLVEDFQSRPEWIARRLGISLHEAKNAIDRLLRLDLLEERDGALRATGSYFSNAAGIPSDAVRKFHHQTLAKAQDALVFQSVEERDFSNITVAINPADLERIRPMIARFRDEIAAELGSAPVRKRVYNLSVQLFALDHAQGPNESIRKSKPAPRRKKESRK